MKIGILTWRLRNYGTALQAYALVNVLISKYGAKANLLNYNLPSTKDLIHTKRSLVDQIHRIAERLVHLIKNRKNSKFHEKYLQDVDSRKQKFNRFYEQIPIDLHTINDSLYYNNTYDFVIVGSDQVWNPKYMNTTYFLDFIDDEKKVSYAPSLGVSSLSLEQKKVFKHYLAKFKYISVRENTAKELLSDILPKKDIYTALDPTMLLSKDEWSRLSKPVPADEPYIFCYFLSANKWYLTKIHEIQMMTGINKIIWLTNEDNLYFFNEEKDLVIDIGPEEFLGLIGNADFVLTDSFHGVCFSIIYNKAFYCFQRFGSKNRDSENSRVMDLLNLFNLKKRFIERNSIVPCISSNDYSCELENYRANSYKYLDCVLGKR